MLIIIAVIVAVIVLELSLFLNYLVIKEIIIGNDNENITDISAYKI